MEEYLKMADAIDLPISRFAEDGSVGNVVDASGESVIYIQQTTRMRTSDSRNAIAEYASHAINSHDELVAEVERLRRQLACAFMAGWEEGINGMECDEAEVASIEIAEQFARN